MLLFAIGGGGDIASAASLSIALEDYGIRTLLASIAWERFVYDPVPGPIELENIKNPMHVGEGFVVVNGDSYAVRGGRRIVFQAARVARSLGRAIYVLDLYTGVDGLKRALMNIVSKERVQYIIGVDVGGDSLALGCEENLWSPLADWMGLSAIYQIDGILAVHSPGSDGELSQEYILARIDELAARGGLIGVKSICNREAEVLEKLLREVNSEASMIPLLAYKGFRGAYSIRRGSRRINITFYNTLTFFLKSKVVVERNPLIEAISSTRSIDEARSILNNNGVYTELDLEEDLYKAGVAPSDLTSSILLDIRQLGLRRVKQNMVKSERCVGSEQ